MDWNSVIDQHGAAFILYARQWTKSHADAEDVVQTAIVGLCRKKGTTKKVPLALIYKSIRNRALDLYRSRQRRIVREETAAELLYEDGIFEMPDMGGLPQQVELALAKLPGVQREVVVMKIWGGLTFREIAKSLKISQNTVTSRYRYAIDKLKMSMNDYE